MPPELPFNLGPEKSALANLPEDESQFPAAAWLKKVLRSCLTRIQLNTDEMKKPALKGPFNISSPINRTNYGTGSSM